MISRHVRMIVVGAAIVLAASSAPALAVTPTPAHFVTSAAAARLAGRVAEFPLGCEGAMRGVIVRLEPGGFTAQTELVAGEFVFDGISPGDYTLVVSPPCNPFGCWQPEDVHVGAADQFLTVCPRLTACVGDCNGDGTVSIDELVAGVRLALGESLPFSCAAFDIDASGVVQIDELVGAVHGALEGCGVGGGTTPTPTPPPPTPPATPTSCRAVVPLVAPVTSPTDALEQTIYLCGIYYASSLVSVAGPTGESIELYESAECPLQCPDSRQQCRAADVPLLPGEHNTIEVCQVPGIGCGPLPDLCVEVEIDQHAAGVE